jgi:hypothetical protein
VKSFPDTMNGQTEHEVSTKADKGRIDRLVLHNFIVIMHIPPTLYRKCFANAILPQLCATEATIRASRDTLTIEIDQREVLAFSNLHLCYLFEEIIQYRICSIREQSIRDTIN